MSGRKKTPPPPGFDARQVAAEWYGVARHTADQLYHMVRRMADELKRPDSRFAGLFDPDDVNRAAVELAAASNTLCGLCPLVGLPPPDPLVLARGD